MLHFNVQELDFEKTGGLIPVIIQSVDNQSVLMLGYMNLEALQQSCATGKVTFYSRTKKRLWTKGETSGNFLNMVSVHKDCDNDTLLIKVRPTGVVCHTGAENCFNLATNHASDFLFHLERVIQQRRVENPASSKSYTNKLFQKGINKIAQKVGEEAVELVIEAKDNNKELFLGEAADLLYHYLVLLTAKNHTLQEVIEVLEKRNNK